MNKEKIKNQGKNINVKSTSPTEEDFTKQLVDGLMNSKDRTQQSELCDSTSMIQLAEVKESFDPLIKNEVKITDKIDQAIDSITKSQTVRSKNLDERINMIKEAHINVSNAEKAVTAGLNGLYVKIGKLLLDTKKIIALDPDEQWGPWSVKNLGFISKRTMQTYMQLAQIPNVEKYIFFGKERLLHTMQVTKGIVEKKDPDPIGTFLQKHEIDFETATDLPLVEFKNMVDTAVFMEKASRKKLNLDRQLVRGLIEMGFKFTNADLNEFKRIKKAEGDPNKDLTELLKNKGRREDVYDQVQKKRESFIRASTNMRNLVDEIIKEEEFDDIEIKKITDLIKKLEAFKDKVINQ